jgi:hypothetical protein
MKRARMPLAFLLLATIGVAASAQSTRTREDVLRELAEARRMGDIIASGCGGGPLREAFPTAYPKRVLTVTQDTAARTRRAEEASTPNTASTAPSPRQ